MKATWIEVVTIDGAAQLNAMNGDVILAVCRARTPYLAIEFLKAHPEARTIKVAPHTKYYNFPESRQAVPKRSVKPQRLIELENKIFGEELLQLKALPEWDAYHYPEAKTTLHPCNNLKGTHEPEGVCVHFPVWTQAPSRVNDLARIRKDNGHAYLIMDGEGQIYQDQNTRQWGWHAGRGAWWRPLGTAIMSKALIGIEVCSWGRLGDRGDEDPRDPWGNVLKNTVSGRGIPSEHVMPGRYHQFTQAQLVSLTRWILWLNMHYDAFDLDNVVGHSEIATPHGRKSDPGHSMPCTMQEYRELLALLVEHHGLHKTGK